MFTIIEEKKIEIELMKSRFVSYVFHTESLAEFEYFLNKLKKEHLKARHICYGYNIQSNLKYSDDGEPNGTAGKPILRLIENKQLINVTIFVVRYFGGTLLGSGKLLRTYLEAANQVILLSSLVELITENRVLVEIEYDIIDIFKNYLKRMCIDIISIEFSDKILISFYVPMEFKNEFDNLFYGKLKVISINKETHIRR